ncbi:helix-turn-helix domain-containing protein [Nostoc foliaceum]|nr:helix-turn-helix domain-containing protein [Nostoc foliaceum]
MKNSFRVVHTLKVCCLRDLELTSCAKELALRHLKKTDTPIHDVAFLLGFSEPSAFHRAFKRWTGKTPRTYRG